MKFLMLSLLIFLTAGTKSSAKEAYDFDARERLASWIEGIQGIFDENYIRQQGENLKVFLDGEESNQVDRFSLHSTESGAYPSVSRVGYINIPKQYVNETVRFLAFMVVYGKVYSINQGNLEERGFLHDRLLHCLFELYTTRATLHDHEKYAFCSEIDFELTLDLFRTLENSGEWEGLTEVLDFGIKTGLSIAILHEYGHIILGHLDDVELSYDERELQADKFAIERWRRAFGDQAGGFEAILIALQPKSRIVYQTLEAGDPSEVASYERLKSRVAEGCRIIEIMKEWPDNDFPTEDVIGGPYKNGFEFIQSLGGDQRLGASEIQNSAASLYGC